MAIINYSQAIKLEPEDANIHYRRAALFEEVHLILNDHLLSVFASPSIHLSFTTVFHSNTSFFLFQRGDIILAMEDYKRAADLQPSRTEAMFNIGLYHFNNQ